MPSSPFYEEGNYLGQVTSQALGKTSNENPQFILRFKVLGRINPQDPEGYELARQQYERTIYRVITKNTAEYVVKDLERLGFGGSSFGLLDPAHPNHHSFVDQQIEVVCKHEPHYQTGDPREVWGLSYEVENKPIEGAGLDAKKVRELDAMFGAMLPKSKAPAQRPVAQPITQTSRATAGARSAPVNREATVRTLELEDSDIPF